MRNLSIFILSLFVAQLTWAEPQPDIASIDEETQFKFEYHDSAAGINQRTVAGSKQADRKPIQPVEVQPPIPDKTERDVAGMEEQHQETPKKELRYWDFEKEND
jgi:hypothetical protein